jgi:MFS family permease
MIYIKKIFEPYYPPICISYRCFLTLLIQEKLFSVSRGFLLIFGASLPFRKLTVKMDEISMQMLNPRKTDISLSYNVVIGTSVSMIALGMVIASFGVFLKPLSNEFGWTRGDISGAFSVAMVVSGVLAIVTGRLADRFSPRLVVTFLGALLGVACFLLSQTHALYQLYLYFGVITGCGMSVIIPASSLVARTYTRRRGLMTGIILVAVSFGSIVAPPLNSLLIESYQWRNAFMAMGGVVLLLVAIGWALLRDPPPEIPVDNLAGPAVPGETSHSPGGSLLQALRSGPFWTLGLVLFCVGVVQNMILVHIVPHATDIGMSAVAAAATLSVMQVAGAVGNFVAGRTSDVFGNALSLIVSSAVIVFGIALSLIAGPAWILFIVSGVAGAGIGGVMTLRSTLVAELFGLKSHGAITGVIMFISTIGSAVGPLLAGYVYDVTGQYRTAFIITTVICVIGLAAALLLKIKSAAPK